MAWWKTGNGDDVMGDMPADVLGAALDARLAEPGPAPALGDVLKTLEDALNSEPRALLADAQASAYRIAAHTSKGETPGGGDRSSAGRRAAMLAALRQVALAYRDAKGRAPRASELASALKFVLSVPGADGRFAEGVMEFRDIRIAPLAAPGEPA
jgi:hypothetical protein